jgi:RNA polymerase sigma factor (sigma-70 family)
MQERNSLNDRTRRFETAALPHLPAAYNLARWLLRDDQQAEDAVQEACMRAFRFFDDLRGDSARPWLLGIVRNACYDAMRQNRHLADQVEFDEVRDSGVDEPGIGSRPRDGGDPATTWERRALGRRVDAAIEALAPPFREVIVLRELEEMSYEEIARIAGIPVGTVMSRLSRARAMLRDALREEAPPAKPGAQRDAST